MREEVYGYEYGYGYGWRTKKDHGNRPMVFFVLLDRLFVVEGHNWELPAGKEELSTLCSFQILQRQYQRGRPDHRWNHEGRLQTKSKRLHKLAFYGSLHFMNTINSLPEQKKRNQAQSTEA